MIHDIVVALIDTASPWPFPERLQPSFDAQISGDDTYWPSDVVPEVDLLGGIRTGLEVGTPVGATRGGPRRFVFRSEVVEIPVR